MNEKLVRFTVEGDRDMLFANDRLANQLDPASIERRKAQTAFQRDKTDETLRIFMDAEWYGHLYHDPQLGIHIPRKMINATTLKAGKKFKKTGTRSNIAADMATVYSPTGGSAIDLAEGLPHVEAKDVAVLCQNPGYRLQCLASVNGSKVLKARPLIPRGWRAVLEFSVAEDAESVVPFDQFIEVVTRMGRGGFGDWRPTSPTPGEYGTFVIKKVEKSLDGEKWTNIKFNE